MSALLAGAGLFIVALMLADISGSLLGDEGNGGVVTGRAARVVWRVLEPARRRGRNRSSHVVGRIIVLAIPLSWLLSMWVAWTLVFASVPDNVVATSSRLPASSNEKVYFVGYLLVTLGNGEYQPVGTVWQGLAVIATITGFAVLTLGVTFIVPVVQAATTRRRTAALIAVHGTTVAELRRSMDAGTLDQGTIAHEIVALTEAHGAFPVLHFLHTRDSVRSAPAMIARLALAVDDANASPALRRALGNYLTFHPGAKDRDDPATWTDVLRNDGRHVESDR